MLIIGLGSAHLVEWQRRLSNSVIDVGNQASPQMVFFGVEYQARDLSSFVIPIEVLCGYFFLFIALDDGRAGPAAWAARWRKLPNRLEAYTVDISAASPASRCSPRAHSSSCRRSGGSRFVIGGPGVLPAARRIACAASR